MADHIEDIERVEQIKAWLSRYAMPIIVGVVLGLVLIYGGQFWQQRQVKTNENAAALYEQITQSWVNASALQKQTMASQLVEQYPKTVYADFANLALAGLAANQQDYAKASQLLETVVRQGRDDGLKEIAKIRLARVLGAEGKIDDGLSVLDSRTPQGFTVLVDATRGDLYMLQHNQAKAIQAYQSALAASPNASQLLPLLPYQLQQLTTAGEQA